MMFSETQEDLDEVMLWSTLFQARRVPHMLKDSVKDLRAAFQLFKLICALIGRECDAAHMKSKGVCQLMHKLVTEGLVSVFETFDYCFCAVHATSASAS